MLLGFAFWIFTAVKNDLVFFGLPLDSYLLIITLIITILSYYFYAHFTGLSSERKAVISGDRLFFTLNSKSSWNWDRIRRYPFGLVFPIAGIMVLLLLPFYASFVFIVVILLFERAILKCLLPQWLLPRSNSQNQKRRERLESVHELFGNPDEVK